MTIYEVVTRFFDDGMVRVAFHTYDLDKKPENRSEETRYCDIYHDYFTNKKEAYKHYDNAKKA